MDLGISWKRIGTWVRGLGPWGKIGLLLLIVVLIYGTTIAVNNLWLMDWLTGWAGPSPDLPVYQERAQNIIDGKMLYGDFMVESPPLINYLLVPPQLLGGEGWIYAAYFSFFTFLTGAVIYLALRRFDEHLGFLSGFLFILSPFAYLESTWGVQDESIVILFFLLPPLLLLIRKVRLGAVALGVSIMTKMLSIMLFPIIFIGERPWKKHLESLLLLILVILFVSLPFLICCPEEFLSFPTYYFLGNEGAVMGGMSFWHFLEVGGLVIPGGVAAAITVVSFVIATAFVFRNGLQVWQAALILVMTFFTFYPKIHLGYFLIPIALLIPWAVEDSRVLIRCWTAFIPLVLAASFSDGVLGAPAIDVSWAWMAGLVFSLIGFMVLWDATRIALKTNNFTDSVDVKVGKEPNTGKHSLGE